MTRTWPAPTNGVTAEPVPSGLRKVPATSKGYVVPSVFWSTRVTDTCLEVAEIAGAVAGTVGLARLRATTTAFAALPIVQKYRMSCHRAPVLVAVAVDCT